MSLISRVITPFVATLALYGQLSPSAYRVLGQPDLRQNGINLVQGAEFNQPSAGSSGNVCGPDALPAEVEDIIIMAPELSDFAGG